MSKVVPESEIKHEDHHDDEVIHEECVAHLEDQRAKRTQRRACCLGVRQHLAKSLHTKNANTESLITKILKSMESPKFELGVVVLVLIDLVLVSFEALIDGLFCVS